MSKTKKTLVIQLSVVLLFIALAATLLACKSAKANRDTKTVVYTNLGAGTPALKQIQDWASDFNKANNPSRPVEITNFTASADMTSKINNELPKDIGPDIALNFANAATDYVIGNSLLKLDENGFNTEDLITRTGGKDENGDPTNSAMKEAIGQPGRQGELWTIPLHQSGPVFYFNQALFDDAGLELPRTWGELEEAGKVIWDKYNIPVFNGSSIIDNYQSMIIQSGSGYIDDKSGEFKFTADKALLKNILQYFQRNIAEHRFVMSSKDELGEQYASDAVLKGKLASYSGSNSHESSFLIEGTTDYRTDEITINGHKMNFELTVAEDMQGGILSTGMGGGFKVESGDYANGEEVVYEKDENGVPVLENDKAQIWTPSFNRQIMIFKSNEERQKIAIDFVKYITDVKTSAIWAAKSSTNTPYLLDSANEQVYLDARAKSKAMTANYRSSTDNNDFKKPYSDSSVLTMFGGRDDVRKTITNTFAKVFNEKMSEDKFDGVINTLVDDINKAISAIKYK